MLFAVIKENGHLEFIEAPDDADDSQLSVLQEIVGGYIESPSILNPSIQHLTMFLNEEGKLDGKCRPNFVATKMVGYEGHDILFGNVAITGPTGREGETTGIDDEARRTLERVWAEAVL